MVSYCWEEEVALLFRSSLMKNTIMATSSKIYFQVWVSTIGTTSNTFLAVSS
jgi:hypothetical protein